MKISLLAVPTLRSLFIALIFVTALLRIGATALAGDEAAVDALPLNLGHGLRQLVVWHRAQPSNLSATERRARLETALPARARRVQTNADATRAVVDVTLDGSVRTAEVRANLVTLGLDVLAVHDPGHGGAIVSARLPLDQAERVAGLPGVRAVALVHRPWKRIGKVTTGGIFSLDAVSLSKAANGAGITIGVLSDSFDVATQDTAGNPLTVHAADDIASGDLPGPGNPLGHTTPVYVLAEGDASNDQNLDEGRAMLQIVHDLAPGATLAFATAGETPETFAQNVRALRTNSTAPCDVLVDDLTFPQEAMFSDGPAAQAVYAVTHDASLPGHKVLYYSAAGNSGDLGYVADFNPVDDAQARAGAFKDNLKLDQVPAELTQGGFHNFNPGTGKVVLAQQVTVKDSEAEVDLQWNSPLQQNETYAADFNLLVFDADGNYLSNLSGKDRNIAMGNVLELVDLPAGDNGAAAVYQLAITCAIQYDPTVPKHLRYVVNAEGEFTAKYTGHNAPTIFGHAAAIGADAVAAFNTIQTGSPERYSSLGPVTILFDADGDPQTPDVRQQPTLAAVDGVNNTFLGIDTDGDGFPNFYGTSAAAPHAAAAAALLLQSAGGPGSLTNQQARALLQSTAAPPQDDPNTANVMGTVAGTNGSTVNLAEVRDDLDPAAASKFFRLSFTGADTQCLKKIVISLDQVAMTFDDSAAGAPFAVSAVSGGLQKSDVIATLGSTYTTLPAAQTYRDQLTLQFAPGSFGPGASVSFGVGINKLRDFRGLDAIQWAMIGTQFTAKIATFPGKNKVEGLIESHPSIQDYSPFTGSGLIDIEKALAALAASGPPTTPDSQMALTPGNLLLTSGQRLVEITRQGKVVQSFDVPEAKVSTVLGNGKVAVLCQNAAGGLYLTLFDPASGDSTTATYPGLQADHNATLQIASQGTNVFVLNLSDLEAAYGEGKTLLRYDSLQKVWQNFGLAAAAGEEAGYVNIFAGLDGLVYAAVAQGFFNDFNGQTEVYDPQSLRMLRTAPPLLGMSALSSEANMVPATVDAAGNIYKFVNVVVGSSEELTVSKVAPDGAILGTINPGLIPFYAAFYPFDNLVVTSDGKLYITTTGGILAVSATLDKVVYDTVPIGNSTVALVGPNSAAK